MRLRSAVEEVENDQASDRVMTRSASNQKKFANRRMTRSSFKQQKGDEKPHQQQQQKKKRKRKRKRKKKKKMTPLADDPTKIFRTPNIGRLRYTLRYFTPEESEAYLKRFHETEGFDMGKYPFEVSLSNPIREISLEEPSDGSLYSTEGAKRAIRDYNRKNRTKYQFVKLVRVCRGFCTGVMYYITFQAQQNGKAPSPPRNFQACVRRFIGMHIEFCREEKKPNLTEGPGEPSQQ